MLRKIVLSLWITLLSIPSYAYIPPSNFIVKSWVKTRKGLKPIRIRNLVTAYSNNKPETTSFKEVLYFNPTAMTLVSSALSSASSPSSPNYPNYKDETGNRLYSVSKSISSAALASVLMLSPDEQAVVSSLLERGIPIRKEFIPVLPTGSSPEAMPAAENEVEALTRIDRQVNKVAWIIGTTDPKDEVRPQIWFEKDTFYPLKLKLLGFAETSQDSSKVYDVTFENYQSIHRLPIPRLIKVLDKNGSVLLTSELIDMTSTFKPEAHLSQGIEKGHFTPMGESASSSMKDLIQIYYDAIR